LKRSWAKYNRLKPEIKSLMNKSLRKDAGYAENLFDYNPIEEFSFKIVEPILGRLA